MVHARKRVRGASVKNESTIVTFMKRILTSLLGAAAVGLFGVSTVNAQDAKPDADGFIRDWLMLAPIPLAQEGAGAEYIVADQVANESALKPKAGDTAKVKDKELTWKKVQSKDYFFDFNETLGSPQENVAGYLVAYAVCEEELTGVTALIGNNDQARLYLNGKEIFKYTEGSTLEKDMSKVENLTLKEGANTIVFKDINEGNNWQACLRFKDKDGKPLTGYTVKLTP